ncbi:hypothetical protein JJD41_14890 [Oxynema sp. CENA135]|uniref:CxC ATPase DNA modification system associated small protein n=1 Tax=Oxynema sp. CENA135 TaxID=984206 RepID=UPI00190E0BE9|nr:CxC ATPase DNA modification system associated small protein [Oxynema sp. CENA135]MBK4731137.1 hypothetical protein [Oxynema sp. CENA135]
MALDQIIKSAIKEVVKDNNQPDNLADELINCLNEISESNTNLDDDDEAEKFVESILNTVLLSD